MSDFNKQLKKEMGVNEADKQDVKKKKKKKDRIVNISQLKTPRFILEQIATGATGATHERDPKRGYSFIKYDRENNEVEYTDEIEIGKYIYKPLNSKLADEQSIYLPTGIEEYSSTDELLKEIKEYLSFYFEVDEMMEKMLPNYVLFTWVFDKFPFVPYLQFVGRTSTGKTTAGETIASVCYKAVDATGAASLSSIFRIADEWGGTLFLDEFDLANANKDNRQAMLSFLKSGVSDRAVLRVESSGKKFEVKPYRVKAPKIFTSEKMINDAGLQSRTIIIRMQKNKRKLPLYKLNTYYEKGQELRNKLLLWRLENLDKIDLSEIEYGFKELSHLDGRVQQILTPIYYLSDKKGKKEILQFAKEQEEQTKEERRNNEDGIIFGLIYDYYEKENAQPPLKYVTDELNEQRQELGYKTKRSERKVSEIVRKIIGLETERVGHDKITTIMIDKNKEKYEELVEYYGLGSLQSVAPVASDADVKDSEPDIVKEADKMFNE